VDNYRKAVDNYSFDELDDYLLYFTLFISYNQNLVHYLRNKSCWRWPPWPSNE